MKFLGLEGKQAKDMRGRSVVRIKKVRCVPEVKLDQGPNDPAKVAARMAAQHGTAANRLTHLARRMQSAHCRRDESARGSTRDLNQRTHP